MRLLAVPLLLALALAGCTSDSSDSSKTATTTGVAEPGPGTTAPIVLGNATPSIGGPGTDGTGASVDPSGLRLRCPQPAASNASAPLQGACVFLDPDEERDREASIATHPTDAATALVTWRVGDDFSDPHIWAAVTTDGGATWSTQILESPQPSAPTASGYYAYDSIARFGPDGTAYVLFGGESTTLAVGGRLIDRMTLALSTDLGQTWAYRTFHELPAGSIGADYPDLAVAPDTGDLYVVAQMYTFVSPACTVGVCSVSDGIWLWHSADAGVSWDPPQVLARNNPRYEIPGAFHYLPRVEAGPGGIVVVTTNGAQDGPFGGHAMVSRDAGKTWTAPQLVHAYESEDGTAINDPVAIGSDGTLHFVYGDGDKVVGYTEKEGGGWSDPVDLARLEGALVWMGAAPVPGGGVAAQVRTSGPGPKGEEGFGMSLLLWGGEGAVEGLTLVAEQGIEGAWKVGDDYAALAVGTDGAAWLAWSDPREGEATIAVAVVET